MLYNNLIICFILSIILKFNVCYDIHHHHGSHYDNIRHENHHPFNHYNREHYRYYDSPNEFVISHYIDDGKLEEVEALKIEQHDVARLGKAKSNKKTVSVHSQNVKGSNKKKRDSVKKTKKDQKVKSETKKKAQ